MNEEPNKLREIVERATAPAKRVPDDLDAETASLRRGWLELGKLIELDIRSDETHDDARLGIELAEFGQVLDTRPEPTESAATSLGPRDRVQAAPNRAFPRRSRTLSYVLLAAASLLIGVGLAFAFRFVSLARSQPGSMTVVAGDTGSKNQLIGPVVHSPEDGDELLTLSDDSVKRITSLSRATMAVVVPFSLL